MNQYLKLLIWIVAYVGTGFALGMITQTSVDGWYADLEKSSLTPPNYVFPIVWSILYVMIATAGWKLWTEKSDRYLKILFIRYTILNFAWTPLFFGFNLIFAGAGVLILLNVCAYLIIKLAWKTVRTVSYLMILPTIWTLFACYLNIVIYALNT